MLRKQTLQVMLFMSATLLCGHTVMAEGVIDVNQPIKQSTPAKAGEKAATFYAQLFMKKMQHAANDVASLTPDQKRCVQTLPANVMQPAFMQAFEQRLSTQDLAKIDAVHTPAFESAFMKITSGARQDQVGSIRLNEDEKDALKQAKNTRIAKVSTLIRSPELKRKSLALFEDAIKNRCGVQKGMS